MKLDDEFKRLLGAEQFSKRDEGRILSLLAKPINYHGRVITKAAWIETLIKEGYRLEYKQGVKKYDFNRTKFNRLEGGQQAEYEKKLKETKDVWVAISSEGTYFELTNTEAEYWKRVEKGK